MDQLKRLYHALVPAPVRYPIGRLRRDLGDRCRRLLTPGPLPPRELLTTVQMTPYLREYLEVGARSAAAVRKALASAGIDPESPARVLDFGCGLGRTLRHLGDLGWRLEGCDVNAESIAWSRRAFPITSFRESAERPPLPYPDATFDALYAISVFTHFDAAEQTLWAAELARILRPGGVAAISLMGLHAFGSFPELATPENRRRLEADGFLFHRRGDAFNQRGAFHTATGLERLLAPTDLTLASWQPGALDGFQDLALLRRTQPRAETGAGSELTPDAPST